MQLTTQTAEALMLQVAILLGDEDLSAKYQQSLLESYVDDNDCAKWCTRYEISCLPASTVSPSIVKHVCSTMHDCHSQANVTGWTQSVMLRKDSSFAQLHLPAAYPLVSVSRQFTIRVRLVLHDLPVLEPKHPRLLWSFQPAAFV